MTVAGRAMTVGMYLDCETRAEALCLQAYWRRKGGDTRRLKAEGFVRVWRVA